jgi:prepilin-type N-terminal cleavage/methylation domain-containing protein
MPCGRRGVTLIEVLVALAILGGVGIAIVGLASQAGHAVRAAAEADRSLREAGAFLDVVALWPREDLDQRLGERMQHPWRMRVLRVGIHTAHNRKSPWPVAPYRIERRRRWAPFARSRSGEKSVLAVWAKGGRERYAGCTVIVYGLVGRQDDKRLEKT